MGTRGIAVAVVAAALFTVLAREGAGAQSQAPDRQPAGRGAMGSMMAGRQAMQAEMEAQAKKLDALVAAMNAPGSGEKIDRGAAVVNELVAQHKAMHARMMSMPMADPAKPPVAADDHAAHH
jgi:hypothetical protein